MCFGQMGLKSVYCKTNIEKNSVWRQHTKLGFREIERKEVIVGTDSSVKVIAIIQEITAEEFKAFNYEKIISLINFFD